MTVKELVKALSKCPQSAHVYRVADWSTLDDDGVVHSLVEIVGVSYQEHGRYKEVILDEMTEEIIKR